jgi:predicted homoserine dehydrogenase-like protein
MIATRIARSASRRAAAPRTAHPARLGIVGTGFIGHGLYMHVRSSTGFAVSSVLTRRNVDSIPNLAVPRETLTTSINELVDASDVIVECSGDVNHATRVVAAAAAAQKPVVTLNPEFHVTAGSVFVDRLVLTEAEGDQPGCEASLVEEARAMGFRPRVVGNMKRYLDLRPTREAATAWAQRYSLSVEQVIAFTDGTKVNCEQVLVANGLGLDIWPEGIKGTPANSVEEGALALAREAARRNVVVSDYVLSATAPPGVFVVAEHDSCQRLYLQYARLGDGPLYYLARTHHLLHLEALKTVARVVDRGSILLNNSRRPRYSVAAIAKRELQRGDRIARGIGSLDLRGEAVGVDRAPGHVPLGVVHNAIVTRRVERDQLLCWDDLEIPESPSLTAWQTVQDAWQVADAGRILA